MNKKFRWFLTLSFKNYAIWLIFECARAKMARIYYLHRSCWVTLEISALRTSPRMEIPLVRLIMAGGNLFILKEGNLGFRQIRLFNHGSNLFFQHFIIFIHWNLQNFSDINRSTAVIENVWKSVIIIHITTLLRLAIKEEK